MSVFARRKTKVTHKRPTTTPDLSTTFADLGSFCIHIPEDIPVVAQSEDDVTAPTAEFLIIFPPKTDLRIGDTLIFKGFEHEVSAVRTYSGRRSGYAEADVVRKEAPEL